MQSTSTISQFEPIADPLAGVLISLGSNLDYGDRAPRAVLADALDCLEAQGDHVIALSSFWISDAWPPNSGAPRFTNAVCRLNPKDDDPALLLSRLHTIEAEFGRTRSHRNRWSARTLDLDLLDYNGLISKNYSFPTLPHPRIAERDFVLRPLLEVMPNWVHPITGESGTHLLENLVKSGQLNNCEPVD
jgi:2-amino-4-hydroxy-6-hydroxymethyldihydropteridine diphosphokinase